MWWKNLWKICLPLSSLAYKHVTSHLFGGNKLSCKMSSVLRYLTCWIAADLEYFFLPEFLSRTSLSILDDSDQSGNSKWSWSRWCVFKLHFNYTGQPCWAWIPFTVFPDRLDHQMTIFPQHFQLFTCSSLNSLVSHWAWAKPKTPDKKPMSCG